MTVERTAAIPAPGVYDIAAADYHADPCPEPSLSASAIKTLLGRSPRHAWVESRRLNPDWRPDDDRKYDKGTAAHAWILEGRNGVEVVEAVDFRTKDARTARDAAYAAGKTPLLPLQWAEVQAMAAAIRPQLDAHDDAAHAFTRGKPEQTLIWQEQGIWCRARPDWLADNHGYIDDYKTTSGSAHPEAETRRLFNMGADIQSAWYKRGVRALGLHRDPHFRFVSQETKPPHALSVLEFNAEAEELANRRIEKAIELWRWCVGNDIWPGYPSQTCFISPPVYREKAQMEAETRDELLRRDGYDLKRLMLDWQAPHREATHAV